MKALFEKIKAYLGRLSFRTGVIVLAMCIPMYIISFAQAALPTSASTKGILWAVFFGLAKTFQYGGLTIIGVEGWKRLKGMMGFGKKGNTPEEDSNTTINE